MRRIKQKTVNFTCHEKSELLDTILDRNLTKIRQLIARKEGYANIPKEEVQIESCENKGKALKNMMNRELSPLKQNMSKNVNMTRLYGNIFHLLELKFDKLSCQTKAQILDFALAGKFKEIRNILKGNYCIQLL